MTKKTGDQTGVKVRDKITYEKGERLLPYDRNNKKHPEDQISLLIQAIDKFGFTNPLLVDENNMIIAGHARYEAGRRLGMDQFPVIKIEDLSESEKKALRISDNRITELAETDWDNLQAEWLDLREEGAGLEFLTGYGEEDLDLFNEEEGEEKKEAEEDAFEMPDEDDIQTDIQKGEIYQLGEHLLICGDATEPEYIERLTDEPADLIFTDPPYGVSYTGVHTNEAKEWESIENDDLRGEDLYRFLLDAFRLAYQHTKDEIAVYVWHASRTQRQFETALIDAGFETKQQLIWNKGMSLSRSDYHWAHEPLFYLRKAGQRTHWYGDRTEKTILRQKRTDLLSLKKEELVQILQNLLNRTTNWEIDREHITTYQHPTQKPVTLAGRAINNNTQEGDRVLDQFAGSGSTLIACEQLSRKARVMELDPKFAEVICRRWETYTGKKREKIEG